MTALILSTAPSADIGPGLGAFVVFFALAVALWLLMRNMSARIRRMSYRDKEDKAASAATRTTGRPSAGEPGVDQDGPTNR